MKMQTYKMGEPIRITISHLSINNKLGRFIDTCSGYPRVHIRKPDDVSNSIRWEDVYTVRWDDIVKVTGQLLFSFMY